MVEQQEVIIKQGCHYNTKWWQPKFTFKDTLFGTVTFCGDFSYDIDKQDDTNKLIGLTDSWHVHKDSIRLGWRYEPISKRIEIMSILYKNGKHTIEHLSWAQNDKPYHFIVSVTKTHYLISFNSVAKIKSRTSTWKRYAPRLILQPFFGGTTKAPKEFSFKFKLY